MAFTQQDLDLLKGIVKSGVAETQFADKRIKYQPIDSIIRAIQIVTNEVNTQAGAPGNRQVRVYTCKGL
jgi:hypothetical protein